MDTIELLISIDKIENLKHYFGKYILNSDDSTQDSISFIASYLDKFKTIVYENGLVIISGKDKDKIYQKINKYKTNYYEQIATSTYGENNYFGPIVAFSIYADENNLDFINNLNVNDALNSFQELKEFSNEVMSNFKCSIKIFKTEDINKKVNKGWSKNRLLSNIINSNNIEIGNNFKNDNLIIIDEFCNKIQYKSYLKKQRLIYENIILVNDSYKQIKLSKIAKILAKYYYILYIKKESKEIGFNIPLNNNNLHDNLDKMHKHLKDKLYTLQNLTKIYYKEVNNILEEYKKQK